ncbi:perilipin-5-like [Brevipalpus obovatus]|uniref:perilipin-5-like n=1 Tax=Brevipalpus obovatus TaxID=246614 RepID=UPI003D9F2D1C
MQRSPLPEIQIISRVSSLPIVKSALGVASEGYEKIKGSNALINNTISAAEQSINYVASLVASNPMTAKFEKIITIADSLACQGLEKLVATVPAITQSPEELYTTGLEKVGEIKKYSNEKVQGLKELGLQKVGHVFAGSNAHALITKFVNTAVELTDKTVDHFLPPSDDEPKSSNSPNASVAIKVTNLSSKLRRRVVRQAVYGYHVVMTPIYGMVSFIPKATEAH